MNRFHVHLNVADLDASVRFYSALFAVEPTVLKPDYAKWMLDDPKVNFAISNTGRMPGVDHLGFQVETDADLGTLGNRLEAAGAARPQCDPGTGTDRERQHQTAGIVGVLTDQVHPAGGGPDAGRVGGEP